LHHIERGGARQYIAGARTRQHQHAHVVRDVVDAHPLGGVLAPLKLIQIMQLRRGGGQHIEVLVRQTAHRQLAFHESGRREQMCQCDAAVGARDFVGADAGEERFGIGTGHFVFGERGKIHEADSLAHGERLLLNRIPPVRAKP
jgi:hypothetical protein